MKTAHVVEEDHCSVYLRSVQASYDGEENVKQATIPITNIGGKDISAEAASEAFDEPLSKEQVTAIVTPFFA